MHHGERTRTGTQSALHCVGMKRGICVAQSRAVAAALVHPVDKLVNLLHDFVVSSISYDDPDVLHDLQRLACSAQPLHHLGVEVAMNDVPCAHDLLRLCTPNIETVMRPRRSTA
jgi:hypothetical protein